MAEVILDELLTECLARGGAVLKLLPGMPPQVEVEGRLVTSRRRRLSDDDIRAMVVDGLSKSQRAELESAKAFVVGHCLRKWDGEVIAFRGEVLLAGGHVVATYRRVDRGSAMDPGGLDYRMRQGAQEALQPVLEAMNRRYGDAGWDLPDGDMDLPDRPPGAGGSRGGGAPVPAPVLPAPPSRSGVAAKPWPPDDLADANPAAE